MATFLPFFYFNTCATYCTFELSPQKRWFDKQVKSKQCENRSRQPKGPLVVDAHVLFSAISFERGLCSCLPSDSSHSVDILLLFVYRKVVHFPRIKSAFTCMCQDVFGVYLQLLSERERKACAQEQRGEKAALCPQRFLVNGAQRLSVHTQNIHQYTNYTHRFTPRLQSR